MGDESELVDMLIEADALKFGEFELSHGGTSDYYIDKYEFETNPRCLQRIGEEFSKLIDDEKLAGVALGAVPLVTATSIMMNREYVIVRKSEKDHGTGNLVEGELASGDPVIVIEDVTTTGKTALQAVDFLRKQGAVVERVLVVVDRKEGAHNLLEENDIKLEPLLSSEDLLSATQ